jgi:hypothetical protein
MREPEQRYFIHKVNPDQTYDSICSGCFRTVATKPRREQLAELEAEHICQQRL